MLTMVIYRGPGVTPEDYAPYEANVRAATVPPEALLHQVAFDDEGLVVVDIWTSRTAFEAWSESFIKPSLLELGLPYVAPNVLDVEVSVARDATAHFIPLKSRAPQPA